MASYVGGIFPSLFAAFFFLKFFAAFFFETTFAYKHFKSKEAQWTDFQHFLKKSFYQALTALGLNPKNWKVAERQYQINKIVNETLDIHYLFKRIELLEHAISVMLKDHQLKGIFLSQITVEKAENKFKEHRLRDRMIKYLFKRTERDRNDFLNDEKERKEKD